MDVGTVQNDGRMMGYGDALSASSSGSAKAKDDQDNALMGVAKGDFLKLLVAQLRNQDPMKPMEDKEFIAQMAQLNTVEQLSAMNVKLNEFLGFEAMAQASALIGKIVEAEPKGGAPVTGIVDEVRLEQGKPLLIVRGRMVGLADVRGIASPG